MLHHARQECAIQQTLNHENIVALHNYTECEDDITIFMEQCNEAMFLENRLVEQHKEIKFESELKDFTTQILRGLQYLHHNRIIHADMKPANILMHRPEVGSKPIMKICDFGISLVIDGTVGKALMDQRSGTAGYIAPEIKANNMLVGPEIDIWAVGIIIYEMCVGYKPT